MKLKTILATSLAKSLKLILTVSGKQGSSLPGKVALALDPQLIRNLSKNKTIIAISGTNGKTTTTQLSTAIFKRAFSGKTIISNASGANMIQGIATTFALDKHPKQAGFAILEVDEANLDLLAQQIPIDTLVLTNLYEDQVDRFQSPAHVLERILKPIKEGKVRFLITNGDLPLFHDLPQYVPSRQFGFSTLNQTDSTKEESCPRCNKPLSYDGQSFFPLGHYYCQHCGLKQNPVDDSVNHIDTLNGQGSIFEINHQAFHLTRPGLYNIYNALAAYSLAKHYDIDEANIQLGFNDIVPLVGRNQRFMVGSTPCLLNLIKNPIGFNQVVSLLSLDPTPCQMIILANNQPADGRDTSWLDKADFESLSKLSIQQIAYGGSCADTLKNRLLKAGLPCNHQIEDFQDLLNFISHDSKPVIILSTYTAMTWLENNLKEKGYLS